MEVMVVPPRLPGRPAARGDGEGRAGREVGVEKKIFSVMHGCGICGIILRKRLVMNYDVVCS